MKKFFLREFFGHFDIALMFLLFFLGIGLTLPHWHRGDIWIALGIGMICYAISEYLIHRFFFHMKPPQNKFLLKLLKRLHYDHHYDPNDLKLLFLPVWYSLPLIATAMFIYYLILQNLDLTIAFGTGIIAYLLAYEWMHYVAHRPIRPLTPWGRWMKKIHLWHHFKNEHYWYGVTNPIFDIALGTYKDEKETTRSKTVRNLEKRESN